MWANVVDTTMESNIMRDLADFDISAPIKVTVCFDTDSDETSDILIKTENETDNDNVPTKDVTNFVDVGDLEPKKNIKEEESRGETEQININEETPHAILKEITTYQAQEIQNKLSSNSDARKRKQQQLQVSKNLKTAKMTEQNKSHDKTKNKSENKSQAKISASTIESCNLIHSQSPENTPLTQSHLKSTVIPAPSNVAPQHDVHIQTKVDKTNFQKVLSDLADNMRRIMEAFFFQKQHNTSKENFKRLKYGYFNQSYDTIVEVILPAEKNKEFIHVFLKETCRHAAEKSYYKCGYQDYAILLSELMTMARNKANYIKQNYNKTRQPTEISENVKIFRELNERREQNNDRKVDNVNKTAELNSLCIFSSGSPGREISINIDPSINSYMISSNANESTKDVRNIVPPRVSIEGQKQSQNPCNALILARTNNKKEINKNPDKQPPSSTSTNMLTMDYQLPRSPEPNRNQSSLVELLTSIDIPTQQSHPILPQEMQSVQSQHELPQQFYHSANVPLQNGQSPCIPSRYGQITNLQLQHGQSQSVHQQYIQPEVQLSLHEERLNEQLQVHSQYGKLQYMQIKHNQTVHHSPQYSMSQKRQQQVVQSPHLQHQYGQSQPIQPHHDQTHNIQQQRSQTHQPINNQYHNVLVQPQAQSNHIFPHGGQVRTAPPPYPHYVLQQHKQPKNSPMQVVLTKPVPPCYEQPQHALPQNQPSKHALSQARQLQQQQANHLKVLLEKPQRREWHQELNTIYNQPIMHQQQIQKSTPRSASTDSGFISPLNFNVSADQTVPPPENETLPLLITHVTSLNPKVSFIDEGECVICKKRAKHMCMGCMKYYYCSYDCQVQDWRNHQGNCKADTNEEQITRT